VPVCKGAKAECKILMQLNPEKSQSLSRVLERIKAFFVAVIFYYCTIAFDNRWDRGGGRRDDFDSRLNFVVVVVEMAAYHTDEFLNRNNPFFGKPIQFKGT
jgi:hypothetical protein